MKGSSAIRWALVLAVWTLLVGCAGAPSGPPPPTFGPAGSVVAAAAPASLDPAIADAASFSRVITYRSRSGIDDDNTSVTGSVFVPKGAPPDGGFRIVVVAPQVVGTDAECAASLSADLLGNAAVVRELLLAGHVVFVPDYQGLGAPAGGDRMRYHPYLDSTTAGYVVIDGVRAAKTVVPVPTSSSWAAVGRREGGQAVWAADELVDNYGSGLTLVATAALSPPADLDGLADAAVAGTLTPAQKVAYVAYLSAVRAEHPYDVDLDDYRRGAAARDWDRLTSCRQPQRLAVAAAIPAEDLRPANAKAVNALRGYLHKTTLPQGPTAAPMYVIYGGADTLTPPGWTEHALRGACRMGDVVQIAYWPDADQDGIDPSAATGWLTDRLQGHPSASDCDEFLARTSDPEPQERASAEPEPAPSTAATAAPPLPQAEGAETSLTSGWLPSTVAVVTVAALGCAIGRRSVDWHRRRLPAALMVGCATAAAVQLFVQHQGWNAGAVSWQWALWTAALGFAAALVVLGWRGAAWWQRAVSVLAVALCAVTAALALNGATGYFPTAAALLRQATGTQPADWIDEGALAELTRSHARPAQGVMVWIDVPGTASGFEHRRELVYLPPAWFTSDPPPQLPVVTMLGAEFSQPGDWAVSADAVRTLDRFAATHGGVAPVAVFPDMSGSFTNDTECVNGPRGNAADHLIEDVVPYVISRFGTSVDPARWGLVGWSTGGTCALLTAVMHPERFGAIVDLDGQLGPNMGTQRQTVARLFGGDENAWAAFDPRTVVERHGRFVNLAAWLGVSGDVPTTHRAAGDHPPTAADLGEWSTASEDRAANATKLCLLLSGHGVECAVVGYGGSHDFRSAGRAFADSLPWLAGRLGAPGAREVPLPGT